MYGEIGGHTAFCDVLANMLVQDCCLSLILHAGCTAAARFVPAPPGASQNLSHTPVVGATLMVPAQHD